MLQMCLVLLNVCDDSSDGETSVLLLHGVYGWKDNMQSFVDAMRKDYPKRHIEAIEVMFGAYYSYNAPASRYIRAAALSIRNAARGRCVDLISHSQGSFLVRNYIQRYNGQQGFPHVRNFYSLAGVLNGLFCQLGNPTCTGYTAEMVANEFYNKVDKYRHVPAGYIRDTLNYEQYLEFNNTICQLNLECKSQKSLPFSALSKFYAIFTTQDEAIRPVTASIMETLKPNSLEIQKLEDQKIYTELGIQHLYQEKRFIRCQFDDPGYNHNVFKRDTFYYDHFRSILIGQEQQNCW